MTYEETLFDLRAQYPNLHVSPIEDSKFIKVIDFIAFWADLDDDYTVTFCNTIYMDSEDIGTARGAKVLRHEAVHVGQWARWNVLYYLSYFLLLPFVLTMRAYWEWQAYKVDLLYEKATTGTISKATEDWIVRVFCGSGYLWMFPFQKTLRRWIGELRTAP